MLWLQLQLHHSFHAKTRLFIHCGLSVSRRSGQKKKRNILQCPTWLFSGERLNASLWERAVILTASCLQNILDHGLRLRWQLEDSLIAYSACCWQMVHVSHPSLLYSQAISVIFMRIPHGDFASWSRMCQAALCCTQSSIVYVWLSSSPHHGSWQPNSMVYISLQLWIRGMNWCNGALVSDWSACQVEMSVLGYGLWLCWEILKGSAGRSPSAWDPQENFGQRCESDYAEKILRQGSAQVGFMCPPLRDTSHQ